MRPPGRTAPPRAAAITVPAAAREVLRKLAPEVGDEWVIALARAAVSSPVWPLTGAELVLVRPRPEPLLAFVGHLTEADLVRLDALRALLAELPVRLRFLDWPAVEEAVERLAESLTRELGGAWLERARFIGVPRGGLVVAGLLTVRLGLDAVALGPPDLARPLVVVDDCGLSGARLRRFLSALDHPEAAIALLCSHPELRRALASSVPGIRAVVSAVDLLDHAPALHGEGYLQWLDRWRTRQPEDLWTGHPDLVAFPWNEPDTAVWNPVTQRSEPGWRVLPASVCLKNRPPPGEGEDAAVVAHEGGSGYLRPPSDVVAEHIGDSIVVVDRRGACVRLRGTAATFWQAVTRAASEDAAAAELHRLFPVPEETIDADLRAFTTAMRDRGLLAPPGEP